MTDLAPPDHDLVPCPSCGAQNESLAPTCERCGTRMPSDTSAEQDADEVELDEAWRAAAAGGFDVDMAVEAGAVRCSRCGTAFALVDADDVAVRAARDTVAPDTDTRVVTLTCPNCGAAGRVQTDAQEVEAQRAEEPEPDPGQRVDEVPPIHERTPGSTEEHPLGSDRQFFPPARPGSLKDQGPLLDAEGDDIREYTGEPVETLDGWVLPQQQNVGPGNEAGGGEWPDPTTPPAQGRDDGSAEADQQRGDDRRPPGDQRTR